MIGDQLWEAGLIHVFSLLPVMKIKLPFMASTFCGGKEIGSKTQFHYLISKSSEPRNNDIKERTIRPAVNSQLKRRARWNSISLIYFSLLSLTFYWIQSNDLCMSSPSVNVSS